MRDHPLLFYTWNAFWASHVLIFFPLLYSWIVLGAADEIFDSSTGEYSIEWEDDAIEFYKSMLLDIVLGFGPFTWLLLVLAFTAVLYLDREIDDDYYAMVNTFITDLFLFVMALATYFMLLDYKFGAIEYYNLDLRYAYMIM